jgi:hypothetical protein
VKAGCRRDLLLVPPLLLHNPGQIPAGREIRLSRPTRGGGGGGGGRGKYLHSSQHHDVRGATVHALRIGKVYLNAVLVDVPAAPRLA